MSIKETKISVFKDLYETKDVPYIITLDKALERIKNGKSKQRVESIRAEKDEKKRGYLKKQSVSIIFGGEFNERKKEGLLNHSGLMITDFDKYPSTEDMLQDLELLKQNPHFVSLFVSPGGMGIKGVVRIPPSNAKDHERYFKKFQDEFNFKYWDTSNCNVDRVCFESYDPNIYINYDANIFSPDLVDEGYNVTERVPILPINDEDKIIELIMQFNWNRNFVEGERNSFVFDLAGMFCEYGVSEYTAIGYIANNVSIGDFSDRELEMAVKSAYKRRSFNIKYFEDYKKLDKIKVDVKNGKDYVLNKHKISEEVFEEIKESQEHNDFWIFEEDKKGNIKVKINPLNYKLFLERNGFKKHFPADADKPTFVRVVSNKVTETSVEKIKDFVLDYLIDRAEVDVWSYCAGYQNLFSEQFLLMLDTIELMMLKDNKYESFIAFNNGILKVTKDDIELMDYIDVDGYIWESQIIQRDFTKVGNIENDYQRFINNIASEETDPIECVIGFLLSTYKNKMNNKAIILNDEVISENPEGGTGKGLFVQGLRQIRKISILDGKAFDDKKSFPYQTVSQDTNVLVFDDVKKNFDFEQKFSLVTEGLTLERKNKDAIKLSVEESPKIVISTNYAIKGEGNSHSRRRHEIEVSQYYNGDKTPYDEFGRQLFDDWDIHDYQRFDNYMVECLQKYLHYGLIEQNAKNIKLRKFIAETAMEFFEWVQDSQNVPINVRKNKIECFEAFVDEYKDFNKWLSRKKFNIWLQKWAKYKGYDYRDGNTNGNRWYELYDGMPQDDDFDNDPF
jgi:hypothetical protein